MTEVDVTVEDAGWERLGDAEALVRRAVEAALGASPRPGPVQVGVLLGSDEAVRALNRSFRGKDRPTNVLSFPAAAQPAGSAEPAPLGDLALAYGTVAAEARAEGKRLEDHVAHLVVHGTLHLLGRDHEVEAEAEAMEALETAILAGLGITDPYRAMAPREERDSPTP